MDDRKVLAALFGSALIGAIVGAASAIVVVSSRAAATSDSADAGTLEQELRALRHALTDATPRFEALAERARSSELAQPAALRREPAGGSPVDVDALRAGLDALFAGLDERLARLETIVASAPGTSGVPRMPVGRLGTPSFPAREVRESREFVLQHLIWDYARVAERYGLPFYSGINDGYVYWGYSLEDGRSVWFDFVDGVVVRVRSQ